MPHRLWSFSAVCCSICDRLGIAELPYPVGKKLRPSPDRDVLWFEVSTFQVIVGNEEVLDLVQVLWPQVF